MRTRKAAPKPAPARRPNVGSAKRPARRRVEGPPPAPPKRSAAAVARKYAEDVLSGAVLACKWVKMAAQRHLDDLRDGHKRGLTFRPDRAQHAVDFFWALRHTKGPWAGTRIVLEPWQVFELASVFGWFRADGTRRFRSVYEEVGRKNAKSTKVGGVALYMIGSDGEEGAEGYCAATTFPQAAIVFKVAKSMVAKSPALRKVWKIWAKSLEHPASASILQPIHSKAESQEGLNVHFAAVDEFHAHKTDELAEVLRQAKGARRQPLIWEITTAGSNRAGPCYERRDYTIKVLEGTIADDAHFGIIYTLDEKDDWRDPAVWIKANPNLGVSVNPVELAEEAHRAKHSTRIQAHFRTKRCNVWVGAMDAYFDIAEWDKCLRPGLTLDDMAGLECYAGLDLAAERDLVAKVMVFRKELETSHMEMRPAAAVLDAGEAQAELVFETVRVPDVEFYVFCTFYLPQFEMENPANKNADAYRGWAEQGWITITPGTGSDYEAVYQGLLKDRERFVLREVAMDPWNAHYLRQRLEVEGILALEVPQNVKEFSGPMKSVNRLLGETARPEVPGHRLYHNGNRTMAWMMGNVVARLDAKDNVFPRKEFPQNKIDGPVALIMGMGRALLHDGGTILTADGLDVF